MPPSPQRYQPLGPVLAGEGSRAFLGLEISAEGVARPVVLVWVPDEAVGQPKLIDQIRRETEHAATLDHPNILKVRGFASIDEGHARITEFADGESLRRVLEAAKTLPARYAARVVADVATGVHFAHLAGNDDGSPLVHGDLRPETVIVSFRGVSQVTGYGALKVAPKELYGNRVTGRRSHCAPEQVIGGRESLLPQTDVYLLGLMLHECLAGTVAHAEEADFDHAVLTKPLPPLPEADVPAALARVLEKATAKKAPDRYPTPLAFREALDEALGTLPSHEDFAAYLLEHFPESHDSRQARRRVIDAGIAEHARRQWAQAAEARAKAPAPPPAPPPAAPIQAFAKPKPPPKPAPAPEPPPRPSGEISRVRPARPSPWAIGVGVLLVVSALAMVLGRGDRKRVPPALSVAEAEPPPPPPTPVAPPAPAPVAEAPKPVEPPASKPRAPSALELVVEPSVEVTIAGQSYGRTPLSAPLAPGRYVVQLQDKAKGISTTRTVTVGEAGKTSEHVVIAKGYVTVSAPADAEVFVDGRSRGRAPLDGELAVYEGSHKLLVTMGKAKWQQAFSLRGGERMYFNVEEQ